MKSVGPTYLGPLMAHVQNPRYDDSGDIYPYPPHVLIKELIAYKAWHQIENIRKMTWLRRLVASVNDKTRV